MALNIAPAAGQQTTTQNPQTISDQNLSAPAESGGIQPGTSNNLLTSDTQGESLGVPSLATVSLVNTTPQTATSSQSSSSSSGSGHHVNAGLLIVPVVLVLAAIVMFGAMTRSAAKSTTD